MENVHTNRPTMPLRLLQVGMGGWGRDWFKVVGAEPGVELAGWVDTNPAALAACRTLHAGVPCFSSLAEALAALEVKALLITASLDAHVPLARAALEAGLHVLLEKPFAPTLAEAHSLVELAAQQQRVLMVSQNYRFHPAPRLVTELVREQRLGLVDAVSVVFRRDYARGRPKGHPYHRTFQPLLLDMAVHHFDLMRATLGLAPQRVYCRAWNPPWSPFIDPASAVATVVFRGGVTMNYQGSWASSGPPTPWAGVWQLECEGGEILWTSRDDHAAGGADWVSVQPRGEDPQRLELPKFTKFDRAGSLASFLSAIRRGGEPESSGQDNLGTLALALATVRSAESGEAEVVARG